MGQPSSPGPPAWVIPASSASRHPAGLVFQSKVCCGCTPRLRWKTDEPAAPAALRGAVSALSAAAAGMVLPPPSNCSGSAVPAAARPLAATRWVSWWFDTHWANSGNATAALAQLKQQGGSHVATSMLLYCGDFVAADGGVRVGTEGRNSSADYCTQRVCCSAMAAQLQAMGIAAERVVTLPTRGDGAGSESGTPLDHLRRMIANPGPAIRALVGLTRAHRLRGISLDVECKSTAEDARAFARFCAQLRGALRPLGARLTVYSNQYDAHLRNVSLLAGAVDRVLDGDTYNYQSLDCPPGFEPLGDGSECESVKSRAIKCRLWGTGTLPACATSGTNFSHWLEHYRNFICAAPLAKAGVAMKGSTGRGTWNCEPAGIAARLRQLQADQVPELAIFSLLENPVSGCNLSSVSPKCGCSSRWFDAAKAFLAQPLPEAEGATTPPSQPTRDGLRTDAASPVWPKPVSSTRAAEGASAPISFANFDIVVGPIDSPDGVLHKAVARYRGIILAQSTAPGEMAPAPAHAPTYTITLAVEDAVAVLSPGPQMNESYVLDAAAAGCTISSHSVWGALRGLDTLSQLVRPSASGGFKLDGPVVIIDRPRFGWRGLMCAHSRRPATPPTILPSARLLTAAAGLTLAGAT